MTRHSDSDLEWLGDPPGTSSKWKARVKLYIIDRNDSDAPLGCLAEIGHADIVLRPEGGGYRVVKNRWGKAGWHAERIEDALPMVSPPPHVVHDGWVYTLTGFRSTPADAHPEVVLKITT